MGDVHLDLRHAGADAYLFAPQRHPAREVLSSRSARRSHQANLFAVANGTLDVATNNSDSLDARTADADATKPTR